MDPRKPANLAGFLFHDLSFENIPAPFRIFVLASKIICFATLQTMTTRKYIHDLLHPHEGSNRTQRAVSIFLAGLIVYSILCVMLETVEGIYSQFEVAFYISEVAIIVIFSLEYVLRLWACVEDEKFRHPFYGRLRYIVSPMSLIDLLSVLPFYAPHLIGSDLRFLWGFRLLRLFRVFKLGEYSASLKTITNVFIKKRRDLVVTFFIIFLLLIISASMMYFLEHDAQPKKFSSIPTSLWWGICTLTTIGYGDMVPLTPAGRFFTGVIMLLAISSFALPSGLLVSGFIEELEVKKNKSKELEYCPYCKEKLPH